MSNASVLVFGICPNSFLGTLRVRSITRKSAEEDKARRGRRRIRREQYPIHGSSSRSSNWPKPVFSGVGNRRSSSNHAGPSSKGEREKGHCSYKHVYQWHLHSVSCLAIFHERPQQCSTTVTFTHERTQPLQPQKQNGNK